MFFKKLIEQRPEQKSLLPFVKKSLEANPSHKDLQFYIDTLSKYRSKKFVHADACSAILGTAGFLSLMGALVSGYFPSQRKAQFAKLFNDYKNNTYLHLGDPVTYTTCYNLHPVKDCTDILDPKNSPLPGGACIELYQQLVEVCESQESDYTSLLICIGLILLIMGISLYLAHSIASRPQMNNTVANLRKDPMLNNMLEVIRDEYVINIDDQRLIKHVIEDLKSIAAGQPIMIKQDTTFHP